ncbi:MAG TPA: nuclear transport factor 2 family protein [Chloroflexota bacterium]|nr:nuclear transport factor 2 family protein [Chloroflexota bacterium]
MTDQPKQVVERAFEAFAAGDVETLRSVLAPDCVLHQCGFLNPVTGADAILELAGRSEGRLSDRTRRISAIVSEGDLVAIRSTVTGKHTGPMFRNPTGRQLQFDVMMFVRLAGGKVAEIWNIQDTASILSQLDAWPD